VLDVRDEPVVMLVAGLREGIHASGMVPRVPGDRASSAP
jgi:hypothetical protein